MLNFWLGDPPKSNMKVCTQIRALHVQMPGQCSRSACNYQLWFRVDAETDQQIRDTFGPTVEAALAGVFRIAGHMAIATCAYFNLDPIGGLKDWEGQAKPLLAKIVLLDQVRACA